MDKLSFWEVQEKNFHHYFAGVFQLIESVKRVVVMNLLVGVFQLWDILPMRHIAESISVTSSTYYQVAQVPSDEDWKIYGFTVTREGAGITISEVVLFDEEDFCIIKNSLDGGVAMRWFSEQLPFIAPGGTRLKFYSTRTSTEDARASLYWKAMKKAQWKA